MFRSKSSFLAFAPSSSALIENPNLTKVFSFQKILFYLKRPPIPQPHSIPFDVRHNLLSAKESASSSYKAAYPFVLRLELAAVQIIAVDSVRKSGSHIAGYLMKAGH